MEGNTTMERKTLIGNILLLLIVFAGLLSGCRNKTENGKIHTSGSIVISGYTPQNPTSQSNITLSVVKSPSNINFKWILNGKPIGANAPFIKHGQYKRGDTLFCHIYHGTEKVGEIGPIIISNTPPLIKSARIVPDNPKYGTDLHVNVIGFDTDNDDISYIYKWYVNDNMVSEDSILRGDNIKGGNRIYAIIIPYDDFSKGQSVKTTTIAVVNSAPIITSSPPTHLTGGKFIYQVKAEDPDGDPITFSLVDPPKGASIDSKNGTVEYTVPPEILGSINFTIKASDNHGNYSLQKFSYTIK